MESIALFTEKHCAFHGVVLSLKSTVLFMELRFSLKSTALFTEKQQKTADSTQISHYDLVFHRVQREGQLGISYILVVFGGAYMCIWCMNAHICLHCYSIDSFQDHLT